MVASGWYLYLYVQNGSLLTVALPGCLLKNTVSSHITRTGRGRMYKGTMSLKILIQSIYRKWSNTYVSARSRNDTPVQPQNRSSPRGRCEQKRKGQERTAISSAGRQAILVIQWYIKSPSQPENFVPQRTTFFPMAYF